MWPCFFILFLFKLKLGQSVEPGVDCLYGAQKDCSPELSKEMFDEAAKSVFQILISTGKEWWPTEGTAMGILRYGQNFDLSNYSFSPIGTDTDIDIMIRVDDDAEWVNIRTSFQEELKNASKHWRWCSISNWYSKVGDKLTCWTDFVVGGKTDHQTIHTDIHRYQVNEKDNYAFMTQSEKLDYPFQKWKNKMVYKGGIADENGMLGVALYDDMPIPCALNVVEMLSHWNGGEYTFDNIKWPYGGFVKDGDHFRWSYKPVNITENDKLKLRKLWNDLHSQGYLSFIENDPQVKRWNTEKKGVVDRQQNFSAERNVNIMSWNVENRIDAGKNETLMLIFYEFLVFVVCVIVYRKLSKLF